MIGKGTSVSKRLASLEPPELGALRFAQEALSVAMDREMMTVPVPGVTWRRLKAVLESQGLRDDDVVESLHWTGALDAPVVFRDEDDSALVWVDSVTLGGELRDVE